MEDYLKQVLDIVRNQASIRAMTEEEMVTMVKKLTEGIRSISEGPLENDKTIDPQTAIKENSIICVCCGKAFKLLTKKHLSTHGLTADEYRNMCGYKKGTRLVCKSLQRKRRNKMKELKLWERRGKNQLPEKAR